MPITSYDLIYDRPMDWGELMTLDNAQIMSFNPGEDRIYASGFGVVKGTGDGVIKTPAANTDVFYGIAIATDTYEKRAGYSITTDGYNGFPAKQKVSILRGGSPGSIIAVPIVEKVNEGDPVFMFVSVATANTKGIAGSFGRAADATATKTMQITYARWYKTSKTPAANTLETGLLELRMPN
jgi:hypothetical protein